MSHGLRNHTAKGSMHDGKPTSYNKCGIQTQSGMHLVIILVVPVRCGTENLKH